jgi:hypothetical protein
MIFCPFFFLLEDRRRKLMIRTTEGSYQGKLLLEMENYPFVTAPLFDEPGTDVLSQAVCSWIKFVSSDDKKQVTLGIAWNFRHLIGRVQEPCLKVDQVEVVQSAHQFDEFLRAEKTFRIATIDEEQYQLHATLRLHIFLEFFGHKILLLANCSWIDKNRNVF